DDGHGRARGGRLGVRLRLVAAREERERQYRRADGRVRAVEQAESGEAQRGLASFERHKSLISRKSAVGAAIAYAFRGQWGPRGGVGGASLSLAPLQAWGGAGPARITHRRHKS